MMPLEPRLAVETEDKKGPRNDVPLAFRACGHGDIGVAVTRHSVVGDEHELLVGTVNGMGCGTQAHKRRSGISIGDGPRSRRTPA